MYCAVCVPACVRVACVRACVMYCVVFGLLCMCVRATIITCVQCSAVRGRIACAMDGVGKEEDENNNKAGGECECCVLAE